MTQGSFVRRRPREFDGTSSAELAVFAATEELLRDTSLQKLTVAQILRAAGLSRANFYHYFANKYDVLVALLGRVFDDSYGQDAPWSTTPGKARAQRMGTSLESTLEMWSAHGAVICSVIEHMHSEPAVAAAWRRMYARFVDAITEQVVYERDSGQAPAGSPPDMIATMLVGAAERVFYVSSRGLDPRLATVDDVVAPLRAVNEAAIFGGRHEAVSDKSPSAATDLERSPMPEITAPVVEGETATAILQALRELLVEESLTDVSVAKILEKSGISRASFYFYFRSKEDAFVVLFREAAADIVAGLRGLADLDRDEPERLLAQVGEWLNLEGFAGPVIRNAVHAWPRLPELRAEYLAAMNAMETTLESIIDSDRAAGLAPAGPPVPAYAAVILWTIERAVAGALAGEEHLADLAAVTEMVGRFLYAAVYGRR